ncbi:MAG TPA: methyltransferase domain-containing protein [Conexibacter sp.]|nr:methyltransferase domain-containing protein [Conexibacter sp.]
MTTGAAASPATAARPAAIRRLNWGCGKHPAPGWLNSDRKQAPGIDLSCDIREGLPLQDASIDYAVSIHALPEVPYPDLVPVLTELRRVLKPGGVLRLGLPNLERAFDAYRRGDRDWFLIPDEEMASAGGKLIAQIVWYGYSRTMFVPGFAEELLRKAGFAQVHHLDGGQTASRYPEIVELDDRPLESFFVEAVR